MVNRVVFILNHVRNLSSLKSDDRSSRIGSYIRYMVNLFLPETRITNMIYLPNDFQFLCFFNRLSSPLSIQFHQKIGNMALYRTF